MKDFINKVKEDGFLAFLSNKWVFSILAGAMLLHLHLSFSQAFLSQDTITLIFLEKALFSFQGSQAQLFKSFYIVSSLAGIFFACFLFYRAFFERFIHYGKGGKRQENKAEIESMIPDFPYNNEELQIIVGLKQNKFNLDPIKYPEYLIIPAAAMFQNFLITGTIGTGKTASVMYPFLKQVMFYQAKNPEKKAGMLILDVKGNFYEQALKYAEECGRKDDILLIQLDGDQFYNPLAKPHMEAVDLASRSRTVMDLFSGGAKKEKFWDTKAGQMMTECIRLMRLTEGYVTLADIHALVTNTDFLQERLEFLYENQDNVSEFEMNACVNYFMGEFSGKAETTIETIKSCVTEMTGFFASSERINKAFCPGKEQLTFTGFDQCINEGKIIILAMNKAQYPEVSRTIAAYLKLDFQSEVQQRTSNPRLNNTRPVTFICDEYQEFVTGNDADFYGLSRESKCCSIVSSQSYTSILKTLGNREAFDTLQQNLINKIWLRTDDKLTIETAQFLTGKEEKEKYSKNISESMNDTKKSKIFGKLVSDKASFSESLNVSTQKDFVFEEKIFTQVLKLFKAICFTANETGMNEPHLVHLCPYFMEPVINIKLEDEQESKDNIPDENNSTIINMKEIMERNKK
ncbi:type IV secretion system DNA-binding domain-containing protein [Aminipila butyrica]|uniref:Type IV secretion system DNA-binding domain-containing protein n=1 Tax=Aminipila butyrica TaxID=433296 RepID=A0A858BXF0_9FIRM|nr:type IV secretion system DNA-binding domain-containing protein [Aminipila butyrica]QIB69788.1 type IV secretion system DNA-binding domain-containing protein [Aminipila butyrica]